MTGMPPLGIERKGKEFKPDVATVAGLNSAAAEAHAWMTFVTDWWPGRRRAAGGTYYNALRRGSQREGVGGQPQSLMHEASIPADATHLKRGTDVLRDGPSARAESFFESLDGPLVLSWMTGPRTDVGEAEFLEELSDIARMKVDAEPLGDDALEVEPSPAHAPVLLTIRTRLDDLRELSQLLRRKARLGPSVQLSMRPSGPDALKR